MNSGLKRSGYERWRQRWVDRAARRMYDRLAEHELVALRAGAAKGLSQALRFD